VHFAGDSTKIAVLEFLGGVPEAVIPDNVKSGVKHPCRYEPDLNPTYREMAEHYGLSRATPGFG